MLTDYRYSYSETHKDKQKRINCTQTAKIYGSTPQYELKNKKNALFSKKTNKIFGGIKKSTYLCIAIKKNGPVAQLNRASDYGSEGYRFESCRGHSRER